MLHREVEVLVAFEFGVGGAVFLGEGVRHPVGRVGAGVDRAVHVDVGGLVGEHDRGLLLARVPARGLLGRVLHHVLDQAEVALAVRFEHRQQRPGLVAEVAEDGVGDLGVRGVAVDEDQPVEAVVDQAAGGVVDDRQQRRRAHRDRPHPALGLAQVVGRVAAPDRRRDQRPGLLRRPPRDFHRVVDVGPERHVVAVHLAGAERDQDRVVGLEVGPDLGRGEVEQLA